MLRILILRIARQRAEYAIVLLQPIISWVQNHVAEPSSLGDMDTYKVFDSLLALFSVYDVFNILSNLFLFLQGYKLLDFLSLLFEHPLAKVCFFTFNFQPNHLFFFFFC